MALYPEVRDLCPHRVTWEAYSGQNAYGEATYATGITYPARVEMKSRLIAGSGGAEIAARGRIFLFSTGVPGARDRLTLPTGFSPTQPPVLDVNPVYDDRGLDHVVVWFGG
jgi:hypothetical protein